MEQQEQLPAPIFALAGNECEYKDGEFLKCKNESSHTDQGPVRNKPIDRLFYWGTI
jgi:hypothetical protein